MNFDFDGEGTWFAVLGTILILGYVAFWAAILWLIWFAIVRFS